MRPLAWQPIRDGILFFAGLAILAHEVLIWEGPERVTVLLVATALLGLPIFVRADERKNGHD